MADEHRRVEPRGIVGSGMLSDPERIEQLEGDRDRLQRTWRDAPKRKFGEVLQEAPPRSSPEEEEREPQRRARGGGDEKRPPDDETEGQQTGAESAPASAEGREEPLPRAPPDPRMARLHAMLDKGARRGGRGGKRS